MNDLPNPSGHSPPLAFRFKVSLPVAVNGGLTEWEIFRVSYGKESDVMARCKTTGEIIRLIGSRTRIVDGVAESMGFLAWPGTNLYLVARKLIREGKAERAGPSD